MNFNVQYISACKFENGDVRVTLTGAVAGLSASAVVQTDTAGAKKLVAAAGLSELQDTHKVGTSKTGKHRGQKYRIYDAGEKPSRGESLASDEQAF